MRNQRLKLAIKNRFINFMRSGWIDFIKEFWFQFRKNVKSNYYQINPYKFGIYIRTKIKRNRRQNLIKEQNRNTVKLNLSKRYVYFALHFEPERTTNPDGGTFHDQFLAILYYEKYFQEILR